MRMLPILACVTLAVAGGCGQGRMMSSPPEEVAPADDGGVCVEPVTTDLMLFEEKVRPILRKCTPCHFEGGKMYDRLPFDDPETIRKLGEALFTRIRDESERAVIRAYLARDPVTADE